MFHESGVHEERRGYGSHAVIIRFLRQDGKTTREKERLTPLQRCQTQPYTRFIIPDVNIDPTVGGASAPPTLERDNHNHACQQLKLGIGLP